MKYTRFSIIFLFFLTISASTFAQIKEYKIEGDTNKYYIMDKATRDAIFEIMDDNLTNESIIESLETSLASAEKRIQIRDSIDAERKKQDSIRQKQVAALKDNAKFKVNGVYLYSEVVYSTADSTFIPSFEVGMNFELFNKIDITPGFQALYYNKSLAIGPFLRLGVKIY